MYIKSLSYPTHSITMGILPLLIPDSKYPQHLKGNKAKSATCTIRSTQSTQRTQKQFHNVVANFIEVCAMPYCSIRKKREPISELPKYSLYAEGFASRWRRRIYLIRRILVCTHQPLPYASDRSICVLHQTSYHFLKPCVHAAAFALMYWTSYV